MSAAKPSKTWLADLIRKHTPTREGMAQNKYLAPIAHRFLSPELWRFTRRSVPRGVALGIFSGLVVTLIAYGSLRAMARRRLERDDA